MKTSRIIIFDAECSFCNASVNFIIKRDPKALFCFALYAFADRSILNARAGTE